MSFFKRKKQAVPNPDDFIQDAIHGEQNIIKSVNGKRKKIEYSNECLYCGDDFMTSRSDSKFCSSRCRQAASKQKSRESHKFVTAYYIFLVFFMQILRELLAMNRTKMNKIDAAINLTYIKMVLSTFRNEIVIPKEYSLTIDQEILPFLKSTMKEVPASVMEESMVTVPEKLITKWTQMHNTIARQLGRQSL